MTGCSLQQHVRRVRTVLALLLVMFVFPLAGAEVDEPKDSGQSKPGLIIRGMGLVDNSKVKRMIEQSHPAAMKGTAFDANFVEDAFAIIRNQLEVDGFLSASVTAHLTTLDGERIEMEWNGDEELEVPSEIQARWARFEADQGPMYFYREFEINGLEAMTREEAIGFFYKTDMLLRLTRNRRFSRSQLNRSLANLRTELVNRGYRNAVVEVGEDDLKMDPATGAVDVRVTVRQGTFYRVNNVLVTIEPGDSGGAPEVRQLDPQVPWSPHWQQDLETDLRHEQYRLGHPDASAVLSSVTTNRVAGVDDEAVVNLALEVVPGENVTLGEVRFEGYEKSRLWWLKSKGEVEGPELDRLDVERARGRLARQGVFDFVGVRYDPPDGPTRDVVFEVDEGKRIDVSLLGGYGSYDQFFGGAELDNYNLWGIGHTSRLRGMLSTKTANVNFSYSIPEMLLPNLSWYGNVDALLREELTFEREEIKTAVGVRKAFPASGFQVGARYSYQFLKTDDSPDPITNDDFTRVSAVILDVQLERRDNPLAPRRGYRLFANLEVADPMIGAEAQYQLVQVGGSAHVPIRRGLIAHGSIQHGVAFSPDSAVDLPFNKRFFDGGENSVRGFERGGASPYNALGQQVGAEVYLLWNLELEQYLTERWSIVAFVDGVGNSPDLADYPFDEVLWSVGGGVRWNTLIGPVRAEYGYNLNPRSFDPEGTLHIAIGFPF